MDKNELPPMCFMCCLVYTSMPISWGGSVTSVPLRVVLILEDGHVMSHSRFTFSCSNDEERLNFPSHIIDISKPGHFIVAIVPLFEDLQLP